MWVTHRATVMDGALGLVQGKKERERGEVRSGAEGGEGRWWVTHRATIFFFAIETVKKKEEERGERLVFGVQGLDLGVE
jgi:hypothetical protein